MINRLNRKFFGTREVPLAEVFEQTLELETANQGKSMFSGST